MFVLALNKLNKQRTKLYEVLANYFLLFIIPPFCFGRLY